MDMRTKILDYCRKIKKFFLILTKRYSSEVYKEHRNFIIEQKVSLGK